MIWHWIFLGAVVLAAAWLVAWLWMELVLLPMRFVDWRRGRRWR